MALKSNSKGQKGGVPPRKPASSFPLKSCKVDRSLFRTYNNLNKHSNQVDTHACLVSHWLVSTITNGDKLPVEASFIKPMKNLFNGAVTSDNFDSDKNSYEIRRKEFQIWNYPPLVFFEDCICLNNQQGSMTVRCKIWNLAA